ncbi:MAG TPA: tetratricopeptide repeat protein [Rudaea sp.]|nr:tetratricopeptide repeat protein [Rudaea sp.]
MSGSAQEFPNAQHAFARGDFITAFDAASRFLATVPAHLQARALRANAALQLERWADAISDLDWLLARQPDHAAIRRNLSVCWMRLGNRHKQRGEPAHAETAYRNALKTLPDNSDAHFNFGMLLLELHRAHAAVQHLQRAVDADPSNVAFLLKLAEAQIAIDAHAAALSVLESITTRGGTREQLQQCSRLLLRATSPGAAKQLMLRLIDARPEASAWGYEFCRQLRKDSDLAGSREILTVLRGRASDPAEQLRIDIAAALGLPSTYSGKAELLTIRDEYSRLLDGLTDAYAPQRVARLAPPPEALLWDNFLLAYQGEDDRELQRKFGTWLSTCLQALLPQRMQTRPRAMRSLPRLAMVSSRFHQCTIGSYFASWVEFLGHAGWELLLVHVGEHRDELSARLARAAHREIGLAGSLAAAARTLQDLDADIILYPELGMDLRTLGLAALRLAPVQVCAWGHPDTTGLPTIDAFLSCAEMEPADAVSHYTERLLGLPGLGTRYLSHRLPEPAPRARLDLPDKGVLYLVPQSLFKLHPDNDAVFVDIAQRDQAAVFVFFESQDGGARNVFDARISRVFDKAGIDTTARFRFLQQRPRADYLRVNMACDVMLDTLRFSGGNTSLDALHAGLPIVTCPGRFMRGRQSMAMLRRLGMTELIAETPKQFAELAVKIANDRSGRNELVQRINAGLPDLAGSEAPLHALDAHLKSLLAGR